MLTAPRLGLATLAAVPRESRPRVDARSLRVGIVHLGIGAFHRAHQAVYTEDAIAAAGGDWGICGVTERSRAVVDDLAPQDGLYTVAVRDGGGESLHVVGSVRELLWAHADLPGLLERIAAPTTHVISLTVTEKGYRHDPATGRLALEDPEIAADLDGRAPRTVVGQLARGLERRRRDSGAPVTVVCCDNLPANGPLLSSLVRDFAARIDAGDGLVGWIDDSVRFPATMVDRITPAATADDRADVAAALGVRDAGVVVTEPFRQWVIEDDFAGPRPAWERAGAILTGDVRPYEDVKLRMLNGAHSTIAYLGALAGYELVADAVAPATPFAPVLRALMTDDVIPTLRAPAGFDLGAYEDELMERFANPALRHRTLQIAIDGSQKLPQRLLGTVRDRLRAGAEPAMAALGVAAWMRFVSARRSDGGRPLPVDDPLADVIAHRLGGAEDPGSVVAGLLSLTEVFDPELAAEPGFRRLVQEHLEMLTRDGAELTARRLLR
ncbi:MAG: mannitol dehydrogenase family protein [Solirubrobacteraceae bacterium]